MFHGTQDALPLPSRLNLERYKKLAKELVKACKSGDEKAIGVWTRQWIQTLAGLTGSKSTPQRLAEIDHRTNEVEDFVRRKLSDSKPAARKCALTDAQFVIARAHGFESWRKFAKQLEALPQKSSTVARFEAAADAIVSGDVAALRRSLREDPKLIRANSMRGHGATLLHYVSANGVEGYRQKTPKNIVEITEALLNAGAEIDATANMYGGQCTALGLAATSVHPEQAGVQIALLQTLLEHGARLDLPSAGGKDSLIHSCLANGQPKAAEFLASRGAPMDLAGAAGLGRLDLVKSCFDKNGALKPPATKPQMESGFLSACAFGRKGVVEFLLERGIDPGVRTSYGRTGLHTAAYGAYVDIIKLLLERGSPVDVIDESYHSRPLDVALWVWSNSPDTPESKRCYEVIALLARAGAKLDPQHWYDPQEGRSRMMEKIHADPRMLAALRGKMQAGNAQTEN
jgi:ankyrin repeat protein